MVVVVLSDKASGWFVTQQWVTKTPTYEKDYLLIFILCFSLYNRTLELSWIRGLPTTDLLASLTVNVTTELASRKQYGNRYDKHLTDHALKTLPHIMKRNHLLRMSQERGRRSQGL